MKIMRTKERKHAEGGFTLIEMMVAVTIFTVIMVMGIGALLNISLSDQKSRSQRAVNDSVSFIMEDIVRNIRIGNTYHCLTTTTNMASADGDLSSPLAGPKSCSNNTSTFAIGVERFGGEHPDASSNHLDDQLVYNIRLPESGSDMNDNTHGIIEKSVDGGQTFFDLSPNITPDGNGNDPNVTAIYIDRTKSGFSVVGACPSFSNDCSADMIQPYIVIRLSGTTTYKKTQSSFNIETTVTQRLLDF